jgi:hypothetical protein
MATLASLTLNVEEMLLGVAQIERPWEDSLATGVTDAADLEWRMTSYASWKKNDYAEVLDTTGTADEVVILDENHPNGADVTVRRAQRGTTAHSGAIAGGVGLRKNPPYPRVTIARFINDTINTMLWPGVWYRSRRSLIFDGTASYYPLAAADFDVEEVFQLDLTGETVGDATVNAGTDLWTSTAHGLVVGDHVRFTVSGGGATGYAIDTDYWVLTAPTADTFTLGSTSAATTPVDATANSTNAWTLERRFPSLHPFQRGWWDISTENPARSTGRILRIHRAYSDVETVYYTARTKPLSADIASFPDQLAALLPWGACSMLLGGTRAAPQGVDQKRTTEQFAPRSQFYADSRYFLAMFGELKAQYVKGLRKEKRPLPHWVPLLGVRRG